jgi:hypothetical protein
MKKLVFAIGALALGLTATAPAAHADYAIVKFNSGYCRIWTDTVVAPPDGTFVWFAWLSSSLDTCVGMSERRSPAGIDSQFSGAAGRLRAFLLQPRECLFVDCAPLRLNGPREVHLLTLCEIRKL